MDNASFGRIMVVMALLLLGSFLTAIAFTGITLLPLIVVAVGVSGSNAIPCADITPFCTTATIQQLTQIFISELAFGIASLAGSVFVAFFKFETVNPYLQLSKPQVSISQYANSSALTTEQLIAELKLRVPSR